MPIGAARKKNKSRLGNNQLFLGVLKQPQWPLGGRTLKNATSEKQKKSTEENQCHEVSTRASNL